MKITKSRLKTIIKEELENMQAEGTFGDDGKKLKSVGAALAKKLAGAKQLEPFFAKLQGRDDFEKAQFLASMANNLGLDLTSAAGKLKASQAKLGGVPSEEEPAAAAPAPEEEEAITERQRRR
jgi:hypothetical protein